MAMLAAAATAASSVVRVPQPPCSSIATSVPEVRRPSVAASQHRGAAATSATALRVLRPAWSASAPQNPQTFLPAAPVAAALGTVAGWMQVRRGGRCPRGRGRAAARVAVAVAAASDPASGSQDFGITAFPFSAVVGQEDMKLALLLNLVDPIIGGVMIQGERGTGKSTAVRALVRLLPDISCVADDKYNSDPEDDASMSDEVRARWAAGEQLPVVMRRTPFVELPLGATEDRVTGTIDIERALLEGGKAFEPGILARVNRGILYIDEVNLLDDQLVDVLLDSAAGGWNTVEREGVSVRHPARFVLIGTAHPDEGDLRPQLLDRFGMTVGVRTPYGAQARMEVLTRSSQWARDPGAVERRFAPEDEALKARVLEARGRLRAVITTRELQLGISRLCSWLDVDGLRGDIVTNRAARALAAFEGRSEVSSEDVRRVAVGCLQHRLRQNVISDTLDNGARVTEGLVREFGEGPPLEGESQTAAAPVMAA